MDDNNKLELIESMVGKKIWSSSNCQHLQNLNLTLTSVANIVVSIITYCPYEDSLKIKVISNKVTCVNLNNDTLIHDTPFSKWTLLKDTSYQSIYYWVWSHYSKLLQVINIILLYTIKYIYLKKKKKNGKDVTILCDSHSLLFNKVLVLLHDPLILVCSFIVS